MDPGPQAQKQKLSLIIIPSVPLQHLTLPVLTALGSAGLNVLVHGSGGGAGGGTLLPENTAKVYTNCRLRLHPGSFERLVPRERQTRREITTGGGWVGGEGVMVPDFQAEVETRRDMCGILGIPVDTHWDSSVQL